MWHKSLSGRVNSQKDLGGKGVVPEVLCRGLSTVPVGLLIGQDW